MKKQAKMGRGFTLIELIVILGILVILIAFLVPNFMGYLDEANKTSQDATAKTVYTAILAGATTNGYSIDKLAGSEAANKDKILSDAAVSANLDVVTFKGESPPSTWPGEKKADAYYYTSPTGTGLVTVLSGTKGEFTAQIRQ